MQTQEFVESVAQAADVSNIEDARSICLATIESICMHLPPEQTRELASQLPKELAKAAAAGAQQARNPGQRIALADFFQQVAIRSNKNAAHIETPARATARLFKQALSRGESVDVVMDAPADLDALLSG